MVKRGGLTEMGKLLLLIARERGEDAPLAITEVLGGQNAQGQLAEGSVVPGERPVDAEASLMGMFEGPQGGQGDAVLQLPGGLAETWIRWVHEPSCLWCTALAHSGGRLACCLA